MTSENLNEEEELNSDDPEVKSFLSQGFVKAMAILFVLFIYLVIFLKILFLA
jgi:hypothetical protein